MWLVASLFLPTFISHSFLLGIQVTFLMDSAGLLIDTACCLQGPCVVVEEFRLCCGPLPA